MSVREAGILERAHTPPITAKFERAMRSGGDVGLSVPPGAYINACAKSIKLARISILVNICVV